MNNWANDDSWMTLCNCEDMSCHVLIGVTLGAPCVDTEIDERNMKVANVTNSPSISPSTGRWFKWRTLTLREVIITHLKWFWKSNTTTEHSFNGSEWVENERRFKSRLKQETRITNQKCIFTEWMVHISRSRLVEPTYTHWPKKCYQVVATSSQSSEEGSVEGEDAS